jgi:cyclic-di-GMP phosphodiesterase TipF (flagellum assembly factor)
MRRLTLGFLTASYLCVAAIVALLVWRYGGGWGAGLSAFVGTLGLAFAFHSLIERAVDLGGIRKEVAAIREAHLILAGEIEKIDARLSEVIETVTDDALRKSEELSSDVHMLEDLVQRMGERLEERLAEQEHLARHAPMRFAEDHHGRSESYLEAPASPARRQSSALLDTVRDALAANRVDLYLQAVVSLPQRRTVFYESFTRLRDESGRVLMPAEYLAVAEPEGLMTAIDNLLLFRCVQIVRRLATKDRKVGIFCNISLASLGDEVFFPRFLEFLSANKDLAGALIFEIGQAAFDSRGSIEARNMGKLADLGFRFSLDKVTELDLDFQDLSRSDVKFVKVAARVLLEQIDEVDGGLTLRSLPDLQAADYASLARRYGVEVIAEKVESEREVVDILELDIGYGQGHLFAEPRAIKDTVLAETAPPADFMRSAALQTRRPGRAYG